MNQWVLISKGWKLKATTGRRGERESVRERPKRIVEFIGEIKESETLDISSWCGDDESRERKKVYLDRN